MTLKNFLHWPAWKHILLLASSILTLNILENKSLLISSHPVHIHKHFCGLYHRNNIESGQWLVISATTVFKTHTSDSTASPPNIFLCVSKKKVWFNTSLLTVVNDHFVALNVTKKHFPSILIEDWFCIWNLLSHF